MSKRSRAGIPGRGKRGLPTPRGPIDPKAALTAIGGTTFSWDLASDTLAWGPNAADVLEIPHIGLFPTGAAFADAVEPGSGTTRTDAVLSAEQPDEGSGVPYVARYALRTKADRLVLVEETGRWSADRSGRPALVHGLLRVNASSGRHETFSAGLKSRSALLTQIADDVADAQRSSHAVTLVVGTYDSEDPDLDTSMTDIARRTRPLMRRRDRFAVYGPNRFALALTSCPGSEAHAAIRRILALIEGDETAAASVRRVWLGAASAPDHALDAPELLRRAEEALAVATDRGTSGFALYESKRSRTPAPAVGTAGSDIVQALNDRGLVMAQQAIVDARTRAPVFSDCLPRLRFPDGSLSPANDLASAAEREGIALLVDGRMLELAADHLAAHRRERAALRISPLTLKDSEWLAMLAGHLGARPDIESRLVVEVPETALSDSSAKGRLDAMKALGVAIMLCGFGAGHASLKDLRGLPVDMVKIDGALIQALPLSIENRQLVRGLIDLAHHLGIVVVAAGVDDEATARLLAGWGADCLQGAIGGAPAVPAIADNVLRRATA